MQRYNPKQIEPKWQQKWAESGIYAATEDPARPKRYVLEYFPYPSGSAMHVGHVRNYTIGDVIARYYRMRGYNVMHPMGWDAFGLPAENYAIKNGISPKQAIAENTGKFKSQLMQMGFSYDWDREINSSDPAYYKWTQWFFKLLFERGLAYQKESLQWWCDTDKTVLANEQVEAGKCWRCGNVVTKKPLKQWFFKITDYADRLVEDLDKLDWSDAIKSMQRNWIGKSKGAEVDFRVDGGDKAIRVFTTRPDTLFGATFMVLAPEHPMVQKITTNDQRTAVDEYIRQTQAKSDVERQETDREKTGVFTGSYAINPVNNGRIPVWIADYVLYGYGTGAIMAVPAHDERDREFAKTFNLPVVDVVAQDFGERHDEEAYVEGSVVIGYDEATDRYLGLRWDDGRVWLAGGGRNEGEPFADAARRELVEETGYATKGDLVSLGTPIYSHYYNEKKGSHRRSFAEAFLAIVSADDQQAHGREDHEKFVPEWFEYSKLVAGIDKTDGGVEHWLEVLARAKTAVTEHKNGRVYEAPCYHGEGVMINSDSYDGQPSDEVRELIVQHLEREGVGKEVTNYKIRDWLISRQRYWGAPIPIVHCEKDGAVAVPDDQLPVELPDVESYQPNGEGTSVLAGVHDWVNTTCPKCGGPAKRETDTMDGFACSSWYFLRYPDPHNAEKPFDPDKVKFWAPVDDYIGGAEHAVMHLLYARMWTKVMYDAGLIEFDEPFKALRNHGMILAPDGRKMSKSWGNVIAPDEIIDQGYGADAIRIMELFIGPWNQSANWSVEGMGGCFRFLQRVWNLSQEYLDNRQASDGPFAVADDPTSQQIMRITHKTIQKVTDDLETMGFNTAISAMMECVNELYRVKAEHGFEAAAAWHHSLTAMAQLIAPFAPHVAEELWYQLAEGPVSVHLSEWPQYDEKYLVQNEITIPVQVNGKLRSEITVPADAEEESVKSAALQNEKIRQTLGDSQPKRVIYIPGKIVNIVT